MKQLIPRETVYKGVKMRSRLEAWFARGCDQNQLPWEYEPFCYADENGQWLPDFTLTFEGRKVAVEVKPDTDDWRYFTKRMEIAWSTDPDLILMLWRPDGGWIGKLGQWWEMTYPMVTFDEAYGE